VVPLKASNVPVGNSRASTTMSATVKTSPDISSVRTVKRSPARGDQRTPARLRSWAAVREITFALCVEESAQTMPRANPMAIAATANSDCFHGVPTPLSPARRQLITARPLQNASATTAPATIVQS